MCPRLGRKDPFPATLQPSADILPQQREALQVRCGCPDRHCPSGRPPSARFLQLWLEVEDTVGNGIRGRMVEGIFWQVKRQGEDPYKSSGQSQVC